MSGSWEADGRSWLTDDSPQDLQQASLGSLDGLTVPTTAREVAAKTLQTYNLERVRYFYHIFLVKPGHKANPDSSGVRERLLLVRGAVKYCDCSCSLPQMYADHVSNCSECFTCI